MPLNVDRIMDGGKEKDQEKVQKKIKNTKKTI